MGTEGRAQQEIEQILPSSCCGAFLSKFSEMYIEYCVCLSLRHCPSSLLIVSSLLR